MARTKITRLMRPFDASDEAGVRPGWIVSLRRAGGRTYRYPDAAPVTFEWTPTVGERLAFAMRLRPTVVLP